MQPMMNRANWRFRFLAGFMIIALATNCIGVLDDCQMFAAETAEEKLAEVTKKLEVVSAKLAAAQEELARLKAGADKPVAVPLDLTDHYRTLAANFEKIVSYPAWTVVPRGQQTILNVPLQIGGYICLWGETNTQRGLVFPEKVKDIPVKRVFETIYIYHAAFHVSPEGTPVYDLVMNYKDGTTETIQMLYGDDIRDWYYFPGTEAVSLDPRSKLAWHGYYSDDNTVQPLRFFLTAVDNPRPKEEVTSIDLVSCKKESAGCVMAITTGKSGLIP